MRDGSAGLWGCSDWYDLGGTINAPESVLTSTKPIVALAAYPTVSSVRSIAAAGGGFVSCADPGGALAFIPR